MSNNKNNKRQKQNIHVSPRIIIPSGDFTIEIIMSIALLKFIITEDFTILELDETNSNFDTLLNAYKHSPNTYIIGLGGEYIPQQLTFHWSSSSSSLMNKKKIKNKNKNLQINNYFNDSKRAKIVPLSTVGLIYKLFGKQIIMNITNFKDSAKINWLYERAYFDFIEIIDAYIRKFNLHYNNNENNENLIPRFNDELQKLPSFVKYFNLQLIDYEKYKIKEELFKIKLIKINKIVKILNNSFQNYINYFAFSFLNGEKILFNAYNDSLSMLKFNKFNKFNININENQLLLFKRILILPKFIPWKEHLFNFEKINNLLGNCLYTIYFDSTNNWKISSVPIKPSSFESRKKLPLEWCGLNGIELQKICNVNDAEFVHTQGFIAGASSIEGCIKMALKAVEY